MELYFLVLPFYHPFIFSFRVLKPYIVESVK